MSVATIYQANTDSDTCSGYAIVADIATCYNTSWAYYSIDMCSRAAATSTSSSSSSTSTSSASTSSASEGVSGGAIAGAVVGSVCGLGIIASVSVYLFWFRPKQKREKRKKEIEQDETRLTTTSANDPRTPDIEKSHEVDIKTDLQRPIEMQHMPSELSSPTEGAELPDSVPGIAEVPGDKGGSELPPESYPVELPGDHEYRSSDSIRSER